MITSDIVPVDIDNFLSKSLRKIRFVDNFTDKLVDCYDHGVSPIWLAVSSKYNVVVFAKSNECLVSAKLSDIHQCQALRGDIHYEVDNIKFKETILSQNVAGRIAALACDSSERYLSLLTNTNNGCFAFVYDVCSFSLDHSHKPNVMHTIRLSMDGNVFGVLLRWSTGAELQFAVSLSDCNVTVVSVDQNISNKFSVVGSAQLNYVALCACWSPKGQQIVFGDAAGTLLQYKPTMVLVRSIPTPDNLVAVDRAKLRCLGVCWLSTIEFLVALPDQNNGISIYLICAKKGSQVQWTYYQDAMFCTCNDFLSSTVTFSYIVDWKVVFLSSSKSNEVAVIGKLGNDWKVWTLDEGGRLELPMNENGRKYVLLGMVVDYSSNVPVKLGDRIERPPCPIILLLSSDGLLLPFNIVASDESLHGNLNRASESLQSTIYNSSSEGAEPVSSYIERKTPKKEVATEQIIKPKEYSPKIAQLSSTKDVVPNTAQKEICITNNQDSVLATINEESAKHLPLPVDDSIIRQKRENLSIRLTSVRERMAEMNELKESMQNLNFSVAKNLSALNTTEWSEEFKENADSIQAIVDDVQNWIDYVENDFRNFVEDITERTNQQFLEAKIESDPLTNRVLSFNRMHRMDRIEANYKEIKNKLTKIDLGIDECSKFGVMNGLNTKSEQPSSEVNSEDEEKIVQTARNVCKSITRERRELSKLQQDIVDIEARFAHAKMLEESKPNSKTELMLSGLRMAKKSLAPKLTQIGSAFIVKAHGKPSVSSSSSPISAPLPCNSLDISRLETRLIEATVKSLTAHKPRMVDVGTQFNSIPSSLISASKNISTTGLVTKHEQATSIAAPRDTVSSVAKQEACIGNEPKVPEVKPYSLFTEQPLKYKNVVESVMHGTGFPATPTVKATLELTTNQAQQDASHGCIKSAYTSPSPHPPAQDVLNFSAVKVPSAEYSPLSVASLSKSSTGTPEKRAGVIELSESSETGQLIPHSSAENIMKPSLSNTDDASSAGITSVARTPPIATTTSVSITTTSAAEPKAVSFSFTIPSTLEVPASSAPSVAPSFASQQFADSDAGMIDVDDSLEDSTGIFSSLFLDKASTAAGSQNVFGSGFSSVFNQPASSGTGLFSGGKQKTPTFAGGQSTTSIFGGGTQPTASIFGSNQTSGSGQPSIFGGGTQSNNAGSVFGGGAKNSGSVFGGGTLNAATSSIFSSAMSKSGGTGSAFGDKAAFSGNTTFGGSSAFGAKPVFGQGSAQSSGGTSVFGQGNVSPFGGFKSSGSGGFASLINAGNQSQSSVFGGSTTGFSSLAKQNENKPPIFGSGSQTSDFDSSSFSSWR